MERKSLLKKSENRSIKNKKKYLAPDVGRFILWTRLDGKKCEGEIVDISDPSYLVCKNSKNVNYKVGRKIVEKVFIK